MRAVRVVMTTGALLAAACVPEPTAVYVVPAYVTWLEWPTAVTATQPGTLRVSGYAPCPYRVVFGVSASGAEIRVTAEGHGLGNWGCAGLDAAGSSASGSSGSGAYYDTLLPLPQLTPLSSGLSWFQVWAPMEGPGYWHAGDQLVGGIELGTSADTATRFAGRAAVFTDSSGCWRMRPWSKGPAPQWVFTSAVPLAPRQYAYYGYASGYFVPANPPICGDSVAVRATRLEVDVRPPWAAAFAQPR